MIKQYIIVAAVHFSTSAHFVANDSHQPSSATCLWALEQINSYLETEVLSGLCSTPGIMQLVLNYYWITKTQFLCLNSDTLWSMIHALEFTEWSSHLRCHRNCIFSGLLPFPFLFSPYSHLLFLRILTFESLAHYFPL